MAGDELVTRHFHRVHYFFVTKIGAEAEDLTQRTFLACVQSMDRIATSFRAYLFGVARRTLLKHLRDRPQPAGLDPADPGSELPSPIVSASQRLHDSDERRLLLKALRRVSIEQQIALQMFYWEELSIAEISVVLECPTGTVKARLARGRARLRALIETLPADEALRRSTVSTLGQWAQRLRRSEGES